MCPSEKYDCVEKIVAQLNLVPLHSETSECNGTQCAIATCVAGFSKQLRDSHNFSANEQSTFTCWMMLSSALFEIIFENPDRWDNYTLMMAARYER